MRAGSAPIPQYRRFFSKQRKRNGLPPLGCVRIAGRVRYLGEWNTPKSLEAYRRLLAELQTARADQADAGQAVQQALFLDDSIRRCREAGRELTVQELCAAYLDFADDYYTKNGRPTGHVPNIRRMIRVIDELYACESL